MTSDTITFMDRLSTAEPIAAMEARAAQLRCAVEMTERAMGGKQAYGAPRHIDECLPLSDLQLQAQLTWLGDTAEKVKNGELPERELSRKNQLSFSLREASVSLRDVTVSRTASTERRLRYFRLSGPPRTEHHDH